MFIVFEQRGAWCFLLCVDAGCLVLPVVCRRWRCQVAACGAECGCAAVAGPAWVVVPGDCLGLRTIMYLNGMVKLACTWFFAALADCGGSAAADGCQPAGAGGRCKAAARCGRAGASQLLGAVGLFSCLGCWLGKGRKQCGSGRRTVCACACFGCCRGAVGDSTQDPLWCV